MKFCGTEMFCPECAERVSKKFAPAPDYRKHGPCDIGPDCRICNPETKGVEL